jgi:hypothetical protein
LGNIASRKSLVVAIIRFFHRLSLASSSATLRPETEAAELCGLFPPLTFPGCFRRLLCNVAIDRVQLASGAMHLK